jgi:aryl-alcohol dehydrogenase-like predicted oxidoreductase
MNTSPLILGTMHFGTAIDEKTSFAVLDRFVDAGGEWIDTADVYALWLGKNREYGQSETLIGRWLAARPGVRDRIKIATKTGANPIVPDGWPYDRTGLSATAIDENFAGSLKRLGTDRVDLLFAHLEDRRVPIEETADAFAGLIADGTALRIGLSNHPSWRVERAHSHVPLFALQHSYSYLLPRPGLQLPWQDQPFNMLSSDHLDFAKSNDVEIWAYTALLRGAYDNPAKEFHEFYDHPGTTRRLEVLTEVAAELGVTRGQAVLSWLVGGSPSIRPILGGSTVEQLDSALVGVDLTLPTELRERLDAVG